MDLTIERALPAPLAEAFAAWTSVDALEAWFWPPRFATHAALELRVGGKYHLRSTGLGAGNVIGVRGTIQSVVTSERLTYTWAWDGDDHGTLVEVVFDGQGEQTTLRLVHSGFDSPSDRDNHVTGWNDCIDRLVNYLGKGENTHDG